LEKASTSAPLSTRSLAAAGCSLNAMHSEVIPCTPAVWAAVGNPTSRMGMAEARLRA
jgi:hypothetical protein